MNYVTITDDMLDLLRPVVESESDNDKDNLEDIDMIRDGKIIKRNEMTTFDWQISLCNQLVTALHSNDNNDDGACYDDEGNNDYDD